MSSWIDWRSMTNICKQFQSLCTCRDKACVTYTDSILHLICGWTNSCLNIYMDRVMYNCTSEGTHSHHYITASEIQLRTNVCVHVAVYTNTVYYRLGEGCQACEGVTLYKHSVPQKVKGPCFGRHTVCGPNDKPNLMHIELKCWSWSDFTVVLNYPNCVWQCWFSHFSRCRGCCKFGHLTCVKTRK